MWSMAKPQRPAYYDLVKFAVQKEAEIHFDKAKKTRDPTSKLKATTHFCFNPKKSGLPATPAVWMVAPAPEEGSGKGEATPDPEFLNTSQGSAKTSKSWQAPGAKGHSKTMGTKVTH